MNNTASRYAGSPGATTSTLQPEFTGVPVVGSRKVAPSPATAIAA
jgi:hypothetical protein